MKIRRNSDKQLAIDFYSIQEKYTAYFNKFLETKLGLTYQAIPWQELVSAFGLKEHDKGPKPIFPPAGKIGLMFLKSYTNFSDKDLLENLNANCHYQFFCGIQINQLHPLENFKIISQIRCELAANLSIEATQEALAKHWLPYLENLDSITMDATCYESHIRYPTDVKLLFESVCWIRNLLKKLSKKNWSSYATYQV